MCYAAIHNVLHEAAKMRASLDSHVSDGRRFNGRGTFLRSDS
jgi:hypothetical protein